MSQAFIEASISLAHNSTDCDTKTGDSFIDLKLTEVKKVMLNLQIHDRLATTLGKISPSIQIETDPGLELESEAESAHPNMVREVI